MARILASWVFVLLWASVSSREHADSPGTVEQQLGIMAIRAPPRNLKGFVLHEAAAEQGKVQSDSPSSGDRYPSNLG